MLRKSLTLGNYSIQQRIESQHKSKLKISMLHFYRSAHPV